MRCAIGSAEGLLIYCFSTLSLSPSKAEFLFSEVSGNSAGADINFMFISSPVFVRAVGKVPRDNNFPVGRIG